MFEQFFGVFFNGAQCKSIIITIILY